jgi:hypothetical protein
MHCTLKFIAKGYITCPSCKCGRCKTDDRLTAARMIKCIFLPNLEVQQGHHPRGGRCKLLIEAWAHYLTERERHQRAVENRDTLKIVVIIVDD